MSMIKCPTECEHDYPFQHSVIQHARVITEGGDSVLEVATYVVCRECGHWISSNYGCRHECHEEEGGFTVERFAVNAVD